MQIQNCPGGATNHLERATSLTSSNAWQSVFSFNSPPTQTNWTDLATGYSEGFYRVQSELE